MIDASEIVATASGRCGAEYGTVGLDLGTLLRGERLVRRRDELRQWLELTVVAHLVGRPSRGMPPTLREQLANIPLDVLRTAVSYGIDEAVASRSAAISPRVSAPALAEHVNDATWRHLLNDSPRQVCGPDHRWVATPFREILAIDPLMHTGNAAALRRAQWSWATKYSARLVHDIVLGDKPTSDLEQAFGATRGSEAWHLRIEKARDHGMLDPMVAGILLNLPR